MFEALLTDEQRALRDQAREFVRSVPRQLILDMDADRLPCLRKARTWFRNQRHAQGKRSGRLLLRKERPRPQCSAR